MAKKNTSVVTSRKSPKKSVVKKSVTIMPQLGEEGIDIVVPMVFPNAEIWLRTYRDACISKGIEPKINERFRSWDLERYFFRGIAKNLPFVRKIHLILSDEGQVPFWLDSKKVHIVYHKDIIPKDLLPTFSSSSIEMWLHRIEGLSECFIYCNDDMIATAPMQKEDFFIEGKPVTRCTEKRQEIIGEFLKTCRNSLDIASRDNNVSFDDDVLLRDGHSYAPMLLSVVRGTVERHGEEMRNSCSMFRDKKNMNQYLYTYEQWLGGRCVNGCHTHRYFSLSSDYDKMSKMLLSGTAGVACFNDGGIGDWIEMRAVLYKVLQKLLGNKCEYEL